MWERVRARDHLEKGKGKVRDITVEILISIRDEIRSLREDTNKIRDEIKSLREDTNKRFEHMDKRFEHIEADISVMKQDIKAIAAHFERNYLLLANEVGAVKGRLEAHLQESHH